MLASCDGMIYDEEGDCDPHYKVRFVYDRNLKYTDAFAAEVDEVTLYIVDTDGNIVWQKHEAGDELKTGSYMMDVEGLARAPILLSHGAAAATRPTTPSLATPHSIHIFRRPSVGAPRTTAAGTSPARQCATTSATSTMASSWM